jgi:hypothetical protein
MRTDIPDLRFSPDGEIGVADGSILSYLRAEPGTTLVAYSPLLNGAYTRPGKKLDRAYDHPGTRARLAALDEVVKETGATANQVRVRPVRSATSAIVNRAEVMGPVSCFECARSQALRLNSCRQNGMVWLRRWLRLLVVASA